MLETPNDLQLEYGDANRIADLFGLSPAYVRQVASGIRHNKDVAEMCKLAATDRVAFEKKRKALREKNIREQRQQAAR